MPFLGLAALGIAPGLFWLWFYTRGKHYRPEPRRLIAGTFLLGMATVFPAALLEAAFIDIDLEDPEVALGPLALNMLLVVGPVEEALKYLAVRVYPYRTRYFDEPLDGLVYSAAASLGFASAENFFYVLEFGPEVMIGRAPISTLGHLVFGSFWGYALGRGMGQRGRRAYLVLGLLAAAAFHGAFNVAVFGENFGVGLAMIGLGAVWAMGRFNWARRVSPFRFRRNYPLVKCRQCQALFRVTLPACPECRTPLVRRQALLVCGNCRAPNRSDASFCTLCGDRFEA